MNEVAYVYTGEMEIFESELNRIDFDSFAAFYDKVAGLIARKLDVDKKAVEVYKVSSYSTRTTAKAEYRLHYRIDTDKLKSFIKKCIPYENAKFSFHATGDRIFKINVFIECEKENVSEWKANLVPADVEKKLAEILPHSLVPDVNFYMDYPIITKGRFLIERWYEKTNVCWPSFL